MLREQRRKEILDLVQKEKSATIINLSERLHVSYMTIWRDLAHLEKEGAIRRVRGGALALKSELNDSRLAFPQLEIQPDNRKLQIARYAAEHLVYDNDNLIVEAGTTCSSLVKYLNRKNLTLLTNGLLAAVLAASNTQETTLMCSGGILIETGAFIGPQAEQFFSQFRVDKAFFSAKGLTLEDGFTDPTPLYMQLKCAMMHNAGEAIMLIDSGKIGVRSLVKVMSLEEIDVVVTDSLAPPEIVEGMRQRGIQVFIVD